MATELKPNSKEALDQIILDVQNILTPLGYEVVALEQSTAGGRKIALYVDFLNNNDETKRIGLDDCITANKAVDEYFETTTLLDGHFTLEVSSPGVERPLRKAEDYARFSGRKIRLHTFRSLDKNEVGNELYWEHHKKQKNFIGRLEGLVSDAPDGKKVRLMIDGQLVTVPFELISKAHLEFTEPTESKA